MAQINVGAATESEMKEKKARVEDALHATRAAVDEGIVPGGGVALLSSQAAIDSLKLDGDEAVGAGIVRRASRPRSAMIAENAGQDGAGRRAERARGKKDEPPTATTPRPTPTSNLIKAGVIDPAKVVRMALQNASSVASLLLTTDALVSDLPEKEEKEPAGHAH